MAIDTTPSTVATNALQAIPFSSLIGGPLSAAIQAQAEAAKTTWEFIQNVGLQTDDKGQKQAVNVTFQYQKGGQMVNLNIPLLVIVPIPYIAIDEMTIDFKANISASSSSVSEESSSQQLGGDAKVQASLGWGPFSVKADFSANYSSKKDSKATQDSKYSVEYTMDIHVHAGQESMPAGLAAVLNLLQSSISEGTPGGSIQVSPSVLSYTGVDASGATFAGAGTQVVTLLFRDSQGLNLSNASVTLSTSAAALPKISAITGASDGNATTTSAGFTTDNTGVLSLQVDINGLAKSAFASGVPAYINVAVNKVDGFSATAKLALIINYVSPPTPPTPPATPSAGGN